MILSVECGYIQLYVYVSVEVAVQRDSQRPRPVGKTVIQKMAFQFQCPKPEQRKWEKFTITVQSDLETAHIFSS